MGNIKPYDRFMCNSFELSFIDYWDNSTEEGCFEILNNYECHGVEFEVLLNIDDKYKAYKPINSPCRYWIINLHNSSLKKIKTTPKSKLSNIVDKIIEELG
jgi:hypothetical protein